MRTTVARAHLAIAGVATLAMLGTALIAPIDGTSAVSADVGAAVIGPGGVSDGLALWLDASNPLGDGSIPDDGQVLTTWVDLSGNGNATVNGGNTGAYFTEKPEASALHPADFNGRPALFFNRSTDSRGSVYRVSGLDIRATTRPDVTVVTVYQPTRRTANNGVWGNDDGNWDRFFLSFHPAFGDRVNDGVVGLGPVQRGEVVPNSGSTADPSLMTVAYSGNVQGGTNVGDPNQSFVYFDCAVQRVFTDSTHPTQAQSSLSIGWDGDNSVFGGYIAEMIVYDKRLADADLEAVTRYLAAKYGLGSGCAEFAKTTVFVYPPSLTIAAGDDPDLSPVSYGFEEDVDWLTPPTCSVFDADDDPVSPPFAPGEYVVKCSGGVLPDGYIANYDEIGALTVLEPEAFAGTVFVYPLSQTIRVGESPDLDPMSYGFEDDDDWVEAPDCAVFDTVGGVVTSPVTSVGEFEIGCSGGQLPDGYEADYSEVGILTVLEAEAVDLPEPDVPTGTPRPQTVEWDPRTKHWDVDSPVRLRRASSSGDGVISYTVEEPGTAGCTLGGASGRVLRFTSVGSCRVTASASATADFLSGSVTITIVVNPARVPSQVIHLRASVIDNDTGDVTLVWKTPADTGTHPITRYRIRMRERGDSALQNVGSTGSDDRRFTIEGLDPGSYYFQVRAANAAGGGRGFVVGRVRVTKPDPARAPAPVRDLRAVSANAESGTVVWGWMPPPDTGKGPITRYRVRLRESGDSKYRTIGTVGGDSTRFTTDLEPGSYYLRVRAGNATRFGHAVVVGPVHITG